MASLKLLILFSSALLLISSLSAQTTTASSRPRALVLQVLKDASTRQYITRFVQRTPYTITDLVIDLGGRYMWVDCDKNYVSSTYRPVLCRSAACSLAGNNACIQCSTPGCNNGTCGVGPDNSVTFSGGGRGEVSQDVVALQSTDGSNPLTVVSIPRFIFACASNFLLKGLANGVVGMAGFGRTKISLPSQFSAAFSFPRKFAICLTSSTREDARGVMFFGNGPYYLLPSYNKDDLSKSLTYTPLFTNPISTANSYPLGEPSAEYFIGVKSITINDKPVVLNTGLLTINKTDGYGGTKISTVDPFTVMQSSIYKAVTEAFVKEALAMKLKRVASVKPFGVCFDSKTVLGTRGGARVPTIGLVLQSESVVWRIFGANSMVEVNKDVLCLGFVDGGERPKTSIVIGGHQLEDNLLEFDLATSRLGFTSSLLFRQTTCSNFNFTSAENN